MSEEAEKFGSCHFLSSKKVTNFEKLMHTAPPPPSTPPTLRDYCWHSARAIFPWSMTNFSVKKGNAMVLGNCKLHFVHCSRYSNKIKTIAGSTCMNDMFQGIFVNSVIT